MRSALKLAATTALVTLSAGAALAQDAACDWKPERAVTYIVPWGAGGGTDANSRMLASMLEAKWGTPFNVVNRTGGNGVTGHSAIVNADPDGYTIGAVTVEIDTMHWIGLTDITYKDVTFLGMVDIVPASVLVKADSEFQDLQSLLDHARENPGDLTASGTSLGGIWHLALAGMLNAEGLPPDAIRWIPSQGAAPALQELIAGGVDVATPALSEGKGLIESGDVRALAYMHDSANSALPDVPLTSETLDSGWTLAAFITAGGPAGMDENIACSYSKAMEEIFASDEWAEFKKNRGADVVQMPRDEIEPFVAKTDEDLGAVIKAVGLAAQ
ncbi:tripartite tricarboxylate transporter substrate binding protein [Oceaniglobus roseus]|uniref:tripartite tricarboxylate transporter substrate binding protein n=1 Tax=Oceaniglobus roseus TaxID=1737570 RepID=UPI000C7EDD7A|nr:tripartite tricarboxylate transporter substrate binding protein [Kandeliimicrobium roseum]